MAFERRRYFYLSGGDGGLNSGRDDAMTVRNIWEGLKANTTAHGIPHVNNSRGIVKTLFLSVIATIMVGSLLANLVMTSRKFFGYPVKVSLKIVHENELTFPTITLCNMSPIRREVLVDGHLPDLTSGLRVQKDEKNKRKKHQEFDQDQDLKEENKRRRRAKRSAGICDGGWISRGSKCFKAFAVKTNFTTAKSNCEDLNAELATPEDASEDTFLYDIGPSLTNEHAWLGLQAIGPSWFWLNGSALTWTNWDGSPDTSDICAIVDKSSAQWDSDECDETNQYICQKALMLAMSTTETVATSTTETVYPSTTETVTESSTETIPVGTSTTTAAAVRTTQTAATRTTETVETSTTERVIASTTETLDPSTTEAVAVSTTETVAASITDTVEASTTDTVEASTTETVAASTTETVAASTTNTVAASTTETVAASTTNTVEASTTETVAASTTATVEASTTETVAASTTETVEASTTETVAASDIETVAVSTTEIVAVSTTEAVAGNTTETAATRTTETVATSTTEIVIASTTETVAASTTETVAASTTNGVETSTTETVAASTTETVETGTTETVAASTTETVASTTETVASTDRPINQPSTMSCCCTCSVGNSGGFGMRTDCVRCFDSTLSNISVIANKLDVTATTKRDLTSSAPTTNALVTTMTNPPSMAPVQIQPVVSTNKPIPSSIATGDVYGKERNVFFQEIEEFIEKLAVLDDSTKMSYGFQAHDFILDCRYSGYDCHASEFSSFFSPSLGNCYSFNSGWPTLSSPNGTVHYRKAVKSGRRHGLKLTLNIDQQNYVRQSGDTAGLRMVVHSQGRMPFPEDEGITVSPGHATSIGIRQILIGRKPWPYGNCIDPSLDHSETNIFEKLYPATQYSATACQKTCYQLHVISQCGCGDSYYPLRRNHITTKAAVCGYTNNTQRICKERVAKEFNNNQLDCQCRDPCSDKTYSLEVSVGDWPSKVQKEDVLNHLGPLVSHSFDINDPDEYRDNLIKLEIYFEDFTYEHLYEKPYYPISTYMSDLGGVFGLWMGFSIMTLFEFLEMGMDLFMLVSVKLDIWRKQK